MIIASIPEQYPTHSRNHREKHAIESIEYCILNLFSTPAQAHSTQQIVVNDFVGLIQQAQTDNLLIDPFDREFFVEMLIPAATEIESGAHLLFTMAKTYYAVSSEHMINQIAGINKLSVLQTDEARHAQLQLASNNTMITSLKISQLAQERHELYLQEMQNRQAEYTTYMNNLILFELEETIG
ncbi:unnamed protein product [Adineta steineri]|uniref:Uncharacterized protein n=1 Tax=Adineta steineri TaxID=433720 RepID=A0A818JUI2_9BILA|nr:unnamed protein product [Adineta steineri]CAF3834417.1 unnamed protein product [Adineta steineri]